MALRSAALLERLLTCRQDSRVSVVALGVRGADQSGLDLLLVPAQASVLANRAWARRFRSWERIIPMMTVLCEEYFMSVVHHETFRVRYCERDAYGHLNNINYLRRMQEAAFGASATIGYDFARYDEIGHLWLVRETDIEYLAPLEYGDEVEVKTWMMDMRRFHSRRACEFTDTRTGRLAARASTD